MGKSVDHEEHRMARRWWEGGVLYHIYLRSWADSDGDGFGDLVGATGHLDHLAWLGLDGIWLSPTMPSPDADWGYDVADYFGVHPQLGTLDDLDNFIKQADILGIRVLLDLVPNHTSSSHPWFIDACSNSQSEHRDYYVWADPKADGNPPNNWLDPTGASAWTLDIPSGQYYLHNFLPSQPDLNWWNPAVHVEFEKIMMFWFERGVAGFRIDVAHALYKDQELRDDPPVDNLTTDPQRIGSHFDLMETYSKNRPEVHELYQKWRRYADEFDPPRLLLGETWVHDLDRLAGFYGDLDELNLGFNLPFLFAKFSATALSQTVARTLANLPSGACPVWTGSNHDVSRFPTRWADNDESKTRLALVLLATLPGTLVLYYGDELGLGDIEVAPDAQRDAMTAGISGAPFQRDSARAPMPWTSGPGRGFCSPKVISWLPLPPDDGRDVSSQQSEPNSILFLCKELITLRHAESPKSKDDYQELHSPPHVWHYRVGGLYVAANFSDQPLQIHLGDNSAILLSSSVGKLCEEVPPGITVIEPWVAIVSHDPIRFVESPT